MDTLQTTLDALADVAAEVLSAGLSKAAAEHDRSRQARRDLTDGAALQALLGPQLAKMAAKLSEEIERRTAARYAACLRHPRFGREPLIDEAEAADASLNTAIVAAQVSPGAVANVAFGAAIIRVRAVTQAIGAACIYPTRTAFGGGRSGPRQRRREPTAADIPDEIAAILLRRVHTEAEHEAVIEALRHLERSVDGVLATKLAVLLEQPNGPEYRDTLAGRLRRARAERGLSPDIDDDAGKGDVPPSAALPAATPARKASAAAPGASASSEPVVTQRAEEQASATARFQVRGRQLSSAKERLAQAHAARPRKP